MGLRLGRGELHRLSHALDLLIRWNPSSSDPVGGGAAGWRETLTRRESYVSVFTRSRRETQHQPGRKPWTEALCFGWIDGIRKSIDEVGYTNRFTRRKARSTLSAGNIKRVAELQRLGLMRPAGLKALNARDEARSGTYSYERRAAAKLDDSEEQRFRENPRAWEFSSAQPPSYRRAAVWWVVSPRGKRRGPGGLQRSSNTRGARAPYPH